MPVYPQPNLDPNAAPWGRSVDQRLANLEQDADRKAQNDVNINKQQNSTAQVLAGQIAQLSSVVAQLTSVTNTLAAASNVQYGEMGAASNFSGFYGGSRPSYLITSASGRIEIGYGGSLNGGNGYICYQVVNLDTGAVIVNRNTIQQSPSRRIAITGGASFTPSGYRTEIVDVPVDANLRVTVQLYASDTYVAFLGSSVQAKVTP